jgi:hypothetical protein
VRGFGLTSSAEVEVLATYSAPQQEIPAVTATPGWYVVGAFSLRSAAELRLEFLGSVSVTGLTMRARLFDLSTGLPVSGSDVTITSTTDVSALGPLVSLGGNRNFQIQVECTGGVSGFGIVRTIGPTV